jgi:N-hydroxyarylamine O-acetyltransferase
MDQLRYLTRIGWTGPVEPDLTTLRALHRAHVRAVPFENLDIHVGVPIELDLERILHKIIDRRRGGFCYELNSAFAALLVSIGFRVDLLEGQVYGDAELVPFGHLCLRVTLDAPYLVDVGFGRAFDEPLRIEPGVDQQDAVGPVRIDDTGDGWFDLRTNGARTYRLSSQARDLADFESGCTYHQTSPSSPFTQGTVCSLRTDDGRITIAGAALIETAAGTRTQRAVDPAELGVLLERRFGVVLEPEELRSLAQSASRSA